MTIYSLDVHLSQSGTSLLFHVQLLTLARWQSRRMYTHLLLQELQNYNSLLNNHRRENVGSHQKKIPYIQGQRRSPSKMVGGRNHSYNQTPYQLDMLRQFKQNLCAPEPRDPAETEPDLCLSLLRRYRLAVVCRRGRALDAATWSHSLWLQLLASSLTPQFPQWTS